MQSRIWGATAVYACATHPVLSGPAVEQNEKSAIEELALLNTTPIQKKKDRQDEILVCSAYFAEAMTKSITRTDRSVNCLTSMKDE